MRRLAVYGFVVLAAGLVLAPSALASTGVKHAATGGRHAAPAGVTFSGLGADPTYNISGHVLDFDGNPVAGAEADWGWWDSSNDPFFGGYYYPTDSSGAFSFAGVTGGHANGDDLTVFYPTSPGLQWMESWSLDFSTHNDATLPTPYSFEMQPAHVDVNIAHAPPSRTVAEVTVGQLSVGEAWSDMALSGGAGTAGVLPSSFDDVVAGFFNAQGGMTAETEWMAPGDPPVPVNITAGTTAADPVNLDWNQAQYAYLAGPSWQHSGKPGTTIKIVLKGWPAGETAQISGSVATAVAKTSGGAGNTYVVTAHVSKSSPVGIQEIDTYRVDNPESYVALWDYFQVCTFKASASAIHHGKAVRLSGKVPGTGKVTIYSRTKASGQPSTLTAKGWVKGKSYSIKSGKFVSGLLHPKRTTWYVAKYKGFEFSAFTSVVKVRVH